jgi:hypothetical protein
LFTLEEGLGRTIAWYRELLAVNLAEAALRDADAVGAVY